VIGLMIMFRKYTKNSPEQRACTHQSNGEKIIIYIQVTNSLVRLEIVTCYLKMKIFWYDTIWATPGITESWG